MLNRLCEMSQDGREMHGSDEGRKQGLAAYRCVHGSSTTLRCLVKSKSPVLVHDIDNGRLHKLVETGKLLVDESLFVEEAVNHDPQIVLGERDGRVVHIIIELFLLGHDVEVAFRAVHLAAWSHGIFVTVITCRNIACETMLWERDGEKTTDRGKAKG
jgi:hypothetical protein